MISVCMATFNGAKFIREQLDSIICQLGPKDEIVISDDGSTDGTISIIESYNDNRIRLLHHNKKPNHHKHAMAHYYVSENFENALLQAKGDYIYLSDQDDIWLPNRVALMQRALKSFDCVMCNRSNVDSVLNIIKARGLPDNYLCRKRRLNPFFTGFTGCQMAFTRRLLNNALPFPKDTCVHDAWIGKLAVALGYKTYFFNEPLILYRVHENNVSDTTKQSKHNNPLIFRLSYRLKLIVDIYKRCRKINK